MLGQTVDATGNVVPSDALASPICVGQISKVCEKRGLETFDGQFYFLQIHFVATPNYFPQKSKRAHKISGQLKQICGKLGVFKEHASGISVVARSSRFLDFVDFNAKKTVEDPVG